ncbi:hypothetical protein D3C79_1085530 [compost metagenome]
MPAGLVTSASASPFMVKLLKSSEMNERPSVGDGFHFQTRSTDGRPSASLMPSITSLNSRPDASRAWIW